MTGVPPTGAPPAADHPMNGARQTLLVTAALLRQGERIDRLSRALTVLSLIGLTLAAQPFAAQGFTSQPSAFWPSASWSFASWAMGALSGAALLAGLVELWFALRAGLDAALFEDAARNGPDWASLDAALVGTGLMPEGKAGRPTEARIAGALRLPRWQAGALLAQCVLLVLAALAR